MPEAKVAIQPAELRCSLSPGLTWVPVGIYLEEIRVFHMSLQQVSFKETMPALASQCRTPVAHLLATFDSFLLSVSTLACQRCRGGVKTTYVSVVPAPIAYI